MTIESARGIGTRSLNEKIVDHFVPLLKMCIHTEPSRIFPTHCKEHPVVSLALAKWSEGLS